MENRNWIYLSIAILLEFGEFSSGHAVAARAVAKKGDVMEETTPVSGVV